MSNPKAITEKVAQLIERLEKAGIDTVTNRWEKGIEHHPRSKKLVSDLADIDLIFFDDHFCWKVGGDGDNGEALMYMLDILFELYEKEENNSE